MVKKCIAEVIGTMVLVLFGCGAAVFGGAALGVLGIAFAFGLVIVAMAYSIGSVSGCHINPAVSLAMFINKRMTLKELVFYVISQITGALLGSLLLYAILNIGGFDTLAMGQNLIGDFSWYGALLIEVILTFVFVTAIMAVTGKKGNPNLAGIVIGLALVLVHILGIPLTGTSVNPARSIAPALFVGGEAIKYVWVFIAAPLIGAGLAAVFSKYILDSEK